MWILTGVVLFGGMMLMDFYKAMILSKGSLFLSNGGKRSSRSNEKPWSNEKPTISGEGGQDGNENPDFLGNSKETHREMGFKKNFVQVSVDEEQRRGKKPGLELSSEDGIFFYVNCGEREHSGY